MCCQAILQTVFTPFRRSEVSPLIFEGGGQLVVHPCQGVHGAHHNFFDDFVTLATTGEAPALTACIHMVLKMLGWDFAGTGPKAPEFSTLFQALGVQLDVSRLSRGLVPDSNTDGRRCELVQALSDILE